MNALLLSALLFSVPAQSTTPDSLQAEAVRGGKKSGTIKFEVAPKSTVIYVDGRKKGKAAKVKKVRVRAGKHDLRLVYNKDETEFEVKVQKGNVLVIKYAFEDSGRPLPKVPEPKAKPAPKDKKDQPKEPDKSGDDEPYEDFDSDIPR